MSEAPHSLTATEAARLMREGRLSSVDLVKSCLACIAETEPRLHAWAYLDADAALAQAEELDRIRRAGYATGALHGIPVGLKDIIDTRDMPTERGTPIFFGRRPDADAAIVDRLREAGAVIMGKTVTTELAFMHPAATRNPHNTDHSPGGSSSGSAAAVAAFNVPLAIGTQTNGSVIRPASFCGTYGFKPTRGMISRRGVLQTSVSLDQVGTFGRTLGDVALLADALAGYDPADPASFAHPRPAMTQGVAAEVPVGPNLVWFDMAYHDRLDTDARDGLGAVTDLLGARVERMTPAENLNDLVRVQAIIHEYEICQHLGQVFAENWDQVSPSLQPVITRARKLTAAQYQDALAVKTSAEAFFADLFTEFDAIIAPSATGQAPVFGAGTGDPVFCTLWTLAGLPAVTLPLLVGATGLPVGVQLIGARERDDRLLRTASWIQTRVSASAA
ncbi:MAG: amidase [Rhodobacteraceae bacterium]|nr:amidase [Paracoccaceae bacterium]MCP5342287.1 amidase [Paracoccaceae bacterium]